LDKMVLQYHRIGLRQLVRSNWCRKLRMCSLVISSVVTSDQNNSSSVNSSDR